jgi:hypothetical protein
MSDQFNPYLKWLGIPLKYQPANHYRLLGLENFESDPDVIESAADRQMAHVRTFRTGKRVETAEKVLNELSEARIVLLNAEKKKNYDAQLRSKEEQLRNKEEEQSKQSAKMEAANGQAKSRPPVAMPVSEEETEDASDEAVAAPRPTAAVPRARAPMATPVTTKPPPMPAAAASPMVIGASSSASSRARRRQQSSMLMLAALGAVVLVALVAAALVLPGMLADAGPAVADAGSGATTGGSNSLTTNTSDGTSTNNSTSASSGGNTQPSSGATSSAGGNSSGNNRVTSAGNTATGGTKKPPKDDRRDPLENPARTDDPREDPDDNDSNPDDSNPDDGGPDDGDDPRGDLTDLINNPDKPPRRPPENSDDDLPRLTKTAAPDAAEQAAIEARVKELYPLASKATIEEQRLVAKKLIDDGSAVQDSPDERFVMIRLGADMAAAAGQLEEAMAAMDKIDEQFAGDTSALRLKMVEHASRAVVPLEEKQAIFQAMLPALDAAIAANKFAEVDALVASLLTAARKLNNKELNLALVERRKTAAGMAQQFAKAKEAIETLKTAPDDPEANLIVGSFYAFAKNDWDKGLPLLAKGSDAVLADLAERELNKPSPGNDLAKLGDGWYSRAQKEEQPAKGAMLARAEAHYQEALPAVEGLAKATIEKRLAELASAAAATRPKTVNHQARIVAYGDNHEIYLNGQFLNRAGRDSRGPQDFQQELKSGDILTVKCSSRFGDSGFACVIKWEGDRYIATGVTPGWQLYLPGNFQTWYDPAGIKATSPPRQGSENRHDQVTEATGIRCQSLWGPVPFAATFVLRIP